MRRAVLLLFAMLPVASGQLATKYSVTGQVVDIVTGAPIPGATVTLRDSSFGPHSKVTADQEGRFRVDGRKYVTTAAYADKEGFRWVRYPGADWDCNGHIQRDESGDVVQEILVRMTPLASLSVRVTGVGGEPADGLIAELVRTDNTRSEPEAPVRTQVRRGRAEFTRAITPGEYILRITPGRNTTPPPVGPSRYIRFYYPAEIDRAKAAKLQFAPAERKDNIEVRLLTSYTYKVNGTVVNLVPRRGGQQMRVYARSVDTDSGIWEGVDLPFSGGPFEIAGLPSGTYTVVAEVIEPQKDPLIPDDVAPRDTHSVAVPIRIDRTDFTELLLEVPPGLSLTGSVVFEGRIPPEPELKSLVVGIEPLGIWPQHGKTARLQDGNRFSFDLLPPGRYRLSAGVSAGHYYCKAIRFNGTLLPNGEVELANKPVDDVEILLSDKTGRIDAIITDAVSHPAYGVLVFLFDQSSYHLEPYSVNRIYIAGQSGRIGLPPGDYRLIAFEGITDAKGVSPALLEKHKHETTLVHLEEGERKVIRLIASGGEHGPGGMDY